MSGHLTVCTLACALLVGCSAQGPTRYHLSGTVTFDGKPVPAGTVVLTADGARKNTGPQGLASIHDGRYATTATEGKGFGGGPTVIHVTGLTGPGGSVLCDYELKVDLPRESGSFDIDVPASAAPQMRRPPP